MAPVSKSLALAGAFFALSGLAAPVEKREVVWETVTSVVWTTVEVTTTVYPDQPATTPAAAVTTAPVAATTTTTTPPVVQSEPTPSEAAQTLQQVQKQEAVVPPVISTTQLAPPPAPEPTEQPTSSVAPEPAPEPTTTSTPAPIEATTRANAPVAPAGGGGSSSDSGPCSKSSPCTGEVTFYDTATNKESPSFCETTNDGESENVIALSVGIVDKSDCGKQVQVSYKGVTRTATVVDKCMGCANTAIDMSRHLFGELASMDEGRLSGVKWHFV